MSSRALRRLQREQEQQEQVKHAQSLEDDSLRLQEQEEEDADVEDEDANITKRNAFDMLNEDGNFEHDDDSDKSNEDSTDTVMVSMENVKLQSSAKRKKKKKKKGDRLATPASIGKATLDTKASTPGPDEIDLALKSLSLNSNRADAANKASTVDDSMQTLHSLLAIDTKHLNALNEMKGLFGNVVLEADDQGGAAAAGGGRRRRRGQQMLDLGGALAGRNSPGSRGQGLAGLALRRNVFMQGKEEWPRATGGGLGMEVVEKHDDGTVEYKFVHNTAYQDVQRQFESCVESMDPQRMIQLLQYNRTNGLSMFVLHVR